MPEPRDDTLRAYTVLRRHLQEQPDSSPAVVRWSERLVQDVARLLAAVRAEEREVCAQVAEAEGQNSDGESRGQSPSEAYEGACRQLAAALRQGPDA